MNVTGIDVSRQQRRAPWYVALGLALLALALLVQSALTEARLEVVLLGLGLAAAAALVALLAASPSGLVVRRRD